MYLPIVISLLIASVLIVFYLLRQKSKSETFKSKQNTAENKERNCRDRANAWKKFWLEKVDNQYYWRSDNRYQRYRWCWDCSSRGDCKKRSWGDKLRKDYPLVTKKDIDKIIKDYENYR